jgi:glutamate synthase (NADPH/NADH) small chain
LLLAMGFFGPVPGGIIEQLGLEHDARGNVKSVRVPTGFGATSVPGVFVAGDMGRGQSLVVWAIAEGRRVARTADAYLAQLVLADTSRAAGHAETH